MNLFRIFAAAVLMVLAVVPSWAEQKTIQQLTAESTSDANKKELMRVVIFLNAQMNNNGYASMKTDFENDRLEYFDKEGRLIEETYLDENNDAVTKKYDKSGKLINKNIISDETIIEIALKEAKNNAPAGSAP